jgi:hypothetical protein
MFAYAHTFNVPVRIPVIVLRRLLGSGAGRSGWDSRNVGRAEAEPRTLFPWLDGRACDRFELREPAGEGLLVSRQPAAKTHSLGRGHVS